MKRKHLVFCAGLLIILILLLGLSSASALTREEIDAIVAKGEGSITEAERLALINSNFQADKIPTKTNVGDGASVSVVDGKRRIKLSKVYFKMSFLPEGEYPAGDYGSYKLDKDIEVTYPNGTAPESRTCELQLNGSYLQIADDAVLIEEKDTDWFSGSNSTLQINDNNCTVYAGGVELKKGVPVLILEDDGYLHGFYAGDGTDSSQLVLGDKLNIHRCIRSGHILTYDFGPTYGLPPFGMGWFNGSISTGFEGTLSIHLDLDWDWTWYGAIDIIVKENSVEIKYPDFEVTVFNDFPFDGVSYPITVISDDFGYIFTVDGGVYLHAEGKGQGTTVASTNLKEGIYVTYEFAYGAVFVTDAGWVHDMNYDIKSSDQRGEIYVAYEYGTDYMVASLVGLGLSYDAGLVMEGEASYNHVYPGDPDKKTYWHECEDGECISGDAHMRLGPLSLNSLILGFSHSLYNVLQKDFDPFVYYYTSHTFNDSSMTSPCPHKGYRLNTKVIGSDGNPISGAAVSYTPVAEHYDGATSGTTGDDGMVVLYAPADKEITVTATVTSREDPSITITASKTITKDDDVEDLTLEIDIPVKYVHFRNTTSEIPDPWPPDIDFKPFDSKKVMLPSMIPELPGRQFTGWNTKEDGTGITYEPGTVLTLNDDLTLWAEWETVGDTWYVIYNANGGTKAPKPQLVPRGQDATLTSELPEGGKMIFKGWMPDPQDPGTVYQPGDTLRYTGTKTYVVLYAKWDLSPVTEPIQISFDANGLAGADIPPDVWFPQGTWYQLPHAVAPVGGAYAFAGWSENPKAEEPDFLAEHTYHFYKSVKLYAVWVKLETMTLRFLDPLPDPATGIPAPIIIEPSMSRSVRIPRAIPQKSGRIFLGWNTSADGTGKHYTPGQIITLVKKETRLWAQWDVAGDSWYVIYDANGGTSAPEPQIITRGKNAELTIVRAQSPSLIFRGWSTDPDAVAPEYQPGDILPYVKGRDYVVLYAVWELNPVRRPVIVTFDANGGQLDDVPKKVLTPRWAWIRIPVQQPSWDPQHDFLGWATDPDAKEPEWHAGDVALFKQDTVLYAVWDPHYKVIEGAGSVWFKDSGKTQRFVADGNLKYFKELRIDGLPFSKGVEISSGSTVADISPDAMETLSVGEHTVTFVYVDGEASAGFTVDKKLPPTGDTGHPGLWFTLVLLGAAGLLLGFLPRTAKQKK